MTKTLIVPGLDGSDAPHWQHWWAATDPRSLMAGLSDPGHPVPAGWEIELALRSARTVPVAQRNGVMRALR